MPKQAPLEQVLDGQQHSAKPQWLHFPISIVPAARQAGVERLLEMAASMLAVIRLCAQATNEKVAAAYLQCVPIIFYNSILMKSPMCHGPHTS